MTVNVLPDDSQTKPSMEMELKEALESFAESHPSPGEGGTGAGASGASGASGLLPVKFTDQGSKRFSGGLYRMFYGAILGVLHVLLLLTLGIVPLYYMPWKTDSVVWDEFLMNTFWVTIIPYFLLFCVGIFHLLIGGTVIREFYTGRPPETDNDSDFWSRMSHHGWKLYLGILVAPILVVFFFVSITLHFMATLIVFLFAFLVRVLTRSTRDDFFASFRGAATLSLANVHWLFFPFIKRPGNFTARAKTRPTKARRVLNVFSFVGFAICLPVLDVCTDVIYVLQLLTISFRCYEAVDQPAYWAQSSELVVWIAFGGVSCAIGGLVTLFNFAGYLKRFWSQGKLRPFYEALREVSAEVMGDRYDLHQSVVLSTTSKLVATIGEDILQLLVACGTLGFFGGFSTFWVLNVVTSSLSIAFYWGVLVSKFIFGRTFRGRSGWFIQVNLIVFLGALVAAFPVLIQTTPQFTCRLRPHELTTNSPVDYLADCHFMEHVCLAQPVDYSQVLWDAIHFDFLWLQGNDTVETVKFMEAEDINGWFVIQGNPNLTSVSFPALVSIGVAEYTPQRAQFTIAFNPLLSSLSFPSLASMDSNSRLNLTNNPLLEDVYFPSLHSTYLHQFLGYKGRVHFLDKTITM